MSSPELLTRIAAARIAVLAQTELLHREFGRAESKWKSDGTRVTAVDIAISQNIFRALRASFPNDQMFSEELSEAEGPVAVESRFKIKFQTAEIEQLHTVGHLVDLIAAKLAAQGR